jgi:signal transduction histidine kinase
VVGSFRLALTSDHLSQPVLQAVLFNWITLSYVLSGVLAEWRRPASRLGPLMIGAGFGAGLSNLAWSNEPVLYTVGQAFDLLPVVVFLHVFLAFPTGRLGGRLERALVIAGYLIGVGCQLLVMLLGAFGPDNVIAVTDRPGPVTALYNGELLALSGLALAGIGVLAARRRSRGRPLRRSVGLLVDAFAVALVMIAVLLVAGVLSAPGFLAIQRVTLGVLGLAPIAFLVGLLGARLARAGVGELVVELGTGHADLRALLARALRDPSLSLLYWLPQYRTWADADGRAAELPAEEPRRAVTLIDRDGEHVAAVLHDAALAEEAELLAAVTAAAGMALDNARLRAELHARLDELQGSRMRVLEAGQRERRRLERDLHDGAQQRLVAVSLDLGRLEAHLDADSAARAAVARVKREVATSLKELRDIARGLYPAVLSGHGLGVALESLTALAAVPVRLTVRTGAEDRLTEAVEVAAYYVVCESLANIAKHARASSATVDVAREGTGVVVEVVDDGVGGADTERGTGLRGLADRVEALGGRLRVWTPAGGGTRVRAELPCG